MKKLPSLLALSCSLALAAPLGLAADAPPKVEFPAASPASTLKQRVGLTDIEVNYSRPGVKNRKIFGGLVPYDKVWRTGANSATKIKFSTAVNLNGTEIPAGTYELFTIPSPKTWTVIIHKDSSEWGAYTYDQKNDVARIQAEPQSLAQPVETFTIGIGDIRDESAMLYLDWDKTRVPVKLTVDVSSVVLPQVEAVMSSDAAKKPYFQAAMFYLDHDLDLKKAAEWMDAAVAANPNAFFMAYHQARLQAKMGNKAAALASARRSIELAKQQGGSVSEEYVSLNEALIATLQ